MTKAQEVRSRRLESLQNELSEKTEKIFDWILDLMDEETKKGKFGAIEVYIYYDQDELRFDMEGYYVYDLSKALQKFDRKQIFSKLKEVVEREEGYTATLNTNAAVWDEPAITFKVDVE